MSHGVTLCKCGTVVAQCRCMEGHKNVSYVQKCEHNWTQELENELSEQYNVPANAGRRVLEVELPATRHWLEVALTNLYGFVITLNIADETGGLMKDVDLYSCVKREDLAETISSIYNSY